MTTTLDTSGSVLSPFIYGTPQVRLYWEDLTPLTQGYVEAAFAEGIHAPPLPKEPERLVSPWRFRDLHPDALAAMMADCAAFQGRYGEWPKPKHGAGFWEGRQQGRHLRSDFPPLVLHLSEDGLIHHKEASK